ncbi:SAVED domain-containing protein [Rhizobium leguminosarum]|nr:SAVED domain-containing protein [Rhizobium leguminosarum]
MADAVVAGWSGHDFQARLFWIKASALLDPHKHFVVEVTYEANGPKSFDDVVVRYDPGLQSPTGAPIAADHYQIKFHMDGAGRFGYADLVDPKFLGATAFSLLERLRDAKGAAPRNSAFTLVTIDRIADGDELDNIVSTVDGSLRLDRLFDGSGDKSKKGKIRKLWRDHLGLSSNEELEEILTGLRISAGMMTLEKLRDDVNDAFRRVGLLPCYETAEFKYDGAAKAIKGQQRNRFDRQNFPDLCREQNWFDAAPAKTYNSVSIRSFPVSPVYDLESVPEDTLSLLHLFDERHLRAGGDWQSEVQPAVEQFLNQVAGRHRDIRLNLDAHASIAFLAGSKLGPKSGIAVELVQKGRGAPSIWLPDDGKDGPNPKVTTEEIGEGKEAALVVSLSHDVLDYVRDYVKAKVPEVGRLIHVLPENGPGQQSIAGGQHAGRLADAAADAVRRARLPHGAKTHVFVSGPNAFSFFLGQHRQAMGPCMLYEYDFSGQIDRSYHASFWMK